MAAITQLVWHKATHYALKESVDSRDGIYYHTSNRRFVYVCLTYTFEWTLLQVITYSFVVEKIEVWLVRDWVAWSVVINVTSFFIGFSRHVKPISLHSTCPYVPLYAWIFKITRRILMRFFNRQSDSKGRFLYIIHVYCNRAKPGRVASLVKYIYMNEGTF